MKLMVKFKSVIPEEIVSYFIKIGIAPDDVSEPTEGIFRAKSAYGPGDFTMEKGMIKNSKAGFIGNEEKVEYVKIIDPNDNFNIVSEEIL